ncbi:MAG: hypothetical protein K2J31_02170, partial [Alistipes sp.]|nr:hypothetical protein [Alistipes sp.]
ILYGGSIPTFKNNTVTDSSITLDNSQPCADACANAGAIAGRYSGTTADAVDSSNVATNVEVNIPSSGFEETETGYVITSKSGMEIFATRVNGGETFSGKTVTLAADIDLAGSEWTPIGTATNSFAGVFDGAGYTVSNLAINNAELNYAGLFGRLVSPGVLKNLTIENASIKAHAQVGALSGSVYTGKVENCHVSGLIQIEGSYQTGGLAGSGYATISQCSVIGDAGSYVKGVYEKADFEGDAIGGIIGYACEKNSAENKVISDCEVSLDVTGSRKVGGIAGQCGKDANIYNCRYTGNVATTASEDYISANTGKIMVGGIVGELTGTTLFIKESTITSGSTVTGIDANTTALVLGGSRTSGYQLTEENNTTDGAKLIIPITPWNGDVKEPAYDEAAKTYTINEAAELAWIAEQTNGGNKFSGQTFVLNSDIDLNNVAWTPIGTETNSFAGVFDGAGHTISNLSVSKADQQFIGLFGRSISPAVLKNI